jgi:hypothetical protein
MVAIMLHAGDTVVVRNDIKPDEVHLIKDGYSFHTNSEMCKYAGKTLRIQYVGVDNQDGAFLVVEDNNVWHIDMFIPIETGIDASKFKIEEIMDF